MPGPAQMVRAGANRETRLEGGGGPPANGAPFVAPRFFVDRASPVPPHVQLKDQIKIAYTFGNLRQGDILPSIRDLARELEVGEAVVRRAYKELAELGMLSTRRRKNVTVNYALTRPPTMERLARESARQCDGVLVWARQKGLSSISLARLLLGRATEKESRQPSYAYVDASERAAHELADRIARAWEIKVGALTLRDVSRLTKKEIERLTAILVNSFRYEDLVRVLRRRRTRGARVFPVRVKPKETLIQKIRRLPGASSVLLVFASQDFPRLGPSSVSNYQALVGKRCHVEGMPVSAIPDLAALAGQGKHRLIVVSVHIWDQMPEQVKRLSNVIRTENDIDLQSLEEARVAAGIIV